MGLKIHDKELREEEAKKKNPFETKEATKSVIPLSLWYKVQAPKARPRTEEEPSLGGVVPMHATVEKGCEAVVKRRRTGKQTEKLVVVASSLDTVPLEASSNTSDGCVPGGVVPLHDPGGRTDSQNTLTAEQKRRIEEKRLEALIRQEERVIENRSVNLKMHKLDEQWCTNKEEERHAGKVQHFLRNLGWQRKEDARGGITWIELYALYSIHGGIEDEEENK